MKNLLRFAVFLFAIVFIAFHISGDTARAVIVSSQTSAVRINAEGNVQVRMLITPEVTSDPNYYFGRSHFLKGGKVPEHVHEKSVEITYIVSGTGEYTIAGEKKEVKAGDAVYVPMNVPHSFVNTGNDPVEAVILYSPSGPEKRFYDWKIE